MSAHPDPSEKQAECVWLPDIEDDDDKTKQ